MSNVCITHKITTLTATAARQKQSSVYFVRKYVISSSLRIYDNDIPIVTAMGQTSNIYQFDSNIALEKFFTT